MFYLFYFSRSVIYSFFIFFCIFTWAELPQETVYLTWQQSPSTTMTIQWVSLSKDKRSDVQYKSLKGKEEWIKVSGEGIPFPHAPQYLVHRIELKNLLPDTEYLFQVIPYQEEYRFLTAPAYLMKELTFVVGGDMYHDDIKLVCNTCQKAGQFNPLFALLGGDIAYAVKSRLFSTQSIDRWIDWIKAWHRYMVSSKGHMIPTISAIGNHDLIGQYDQTPAQAAVFSTLFPMPGKQIYNILDFNSYLSIFILDSGHANPVGGQQAQWLRANLDKRKHITHRFALYHVPAYPSVRSFHNKHSAAIRLSWVPLFEEGGIHAAFEHHDHVYKRTHPLLKGRIHPQGILYIGDGGWGVEKARPLKRKRSYIAKSASISHFIVATITPTQQYFKCVSCKGQLVDEFSQPIKNNKPVTIERPNLAL